MIFSHAVHDASAKIASGILNGNGLNQFGDFDQCLSVNAPDDEFQGKYCLTYLQPTVSKSSKFVNHLRKLIASHEAFKSNFDDVSNEFNIIMFYLVNDLWRLCGK